MAVTETHQQPQSLVAATPAAIEELKRLRETEGKDKPGVRLGVPHLRPKSGPMGKSPRTQMRSKLRRRKAVAFLPVMVTHWHCWTSQQLGCHAC